MALSIPAAGSPDAIDRALVRCRILAAVSLLLFSPRLGGAGSLPPWVGVPFAAMLLGANVAVAGGWSRRHVGATGRALAGIVVDLAATVGLLVLVGADPGSPATVLVLLPILEAAVRFRMLGACLTWFAAMAGLAVPAIARVQETGDGPVGDLLAVGPVLLLAALPVAYITTHLTVEIGAARMAHAHAEGRSRLLAELVAVEGRLASLELETVAQATTEACARLGASASDVHVIDRGVGCRRLAGSVGGPSPLPSLDRRNVTRALRAGARALTLPAPGHHLVLACVANVHPQAWVVRMALPAGQPADLVAQALEVLCAQVSTCAMNARLHEELQARRRRLAWRADHDELTGLENRAAARRRLRRLVQEQPSVWVAFVDLDGFKAINDSLGHDAGDTVLRAVAERFTMALGQQAAPARLGGDEFLIVPTDPGARPEELLERIERILARPIQVSPERSVRVSASVGHAIYGGDDVDELLTAADDAMYEEKRRRRSQVAAAGPPESR